MKRLVLLAMLLAMIVLPTGCGDGTVLTSRERQERDRRIFNNDMKQLVDDWDTFMLNDRESRLSRWRKE